MVSYIHFKNKPLIVIAFLYCIVEMHSLKGEFIIKFPMDVVCIATLIIIYFVIIFSFSWKNTGEPIIPGLFV